MKVSREGAIHISSSVLVSWISIGAFLWLIAEPILVSTVSAALADDIKATVQEEVAPINNAFTALLRNDVNKLRKEIARLEFRANQGVNNGWTQEDAEYLEDLKIEMEALRSAIVALSKSNHT